MDGYSRFSRSIGLCLVLLSLDRVEKLETVTLEELQPIKEKMRKIKKAGYQEEILQKLYEGIGYHM
ncbi:hypothetical protein AT864_02582 [Anoxybacillus sp. P3H1B]|uniref:hypothetical protein n=1 Tax=Anoxybacillus sp. P3H1B TaxID=1769293 RepID=UPI00079753B5|nr:hypothetical protein [Anoxybacillus sp. P3H1B]KXG09117.1 hypothetical protein AT864_02582 [Anoxybacillus sp. P3H1B]